jgi:hypothetical protein
LLREAQLQEQEEEEQQQQEVVLKDWRVSSEVKGQRAS